MGECPFCGGEVEQELTTFGGTCPRCFAHIPGEEAATDPGEEVLAAQEASDRARSSRRALLPVLVSLPFVLGFVGLAAWVALRPPPEVAVLDFDDLDAAYTPEIVAASEHDARELAPADDGATSGAGAARVRDGDATPSVAASRLLAAPTSPIGEGGASVSDLGGTASLRVDEGLRPRATGAAAGPAALTGGLSTRTTQSGAMDFGLDVTNSRKAGVLEDPAAIRQMIAERMAGQMQQLNSCYERQLKVEPGLAGRWRIRYTVGADGTVRDARAEGLAASNREFERCMADVVTRWRFGRIVRDQPVQRTVSFRPL